MAKKKKTAFQKKWEKYKVPIIFTLLILMVIGWKACSNPFGSNIKNLRRRGGLIDHTQSIVKHV